MRKILVALVTVIGSFNMTIAQDYKKIYYKSQTIENNDAKIIIDNAVATPGGIKFRLRITNKTNDYLIYKPSESTFIISGRESNPEEKWLIIQPKGDESKTIDVKGTQYNIASNYVFNFDGLYKVHADSKSLNTPDFKLPPAVNEFKTGGFTCSLDKLKKETARTDVRFKVNYSSNKIGIFDPNKVAMKMPDGKEYANYHSDKKPLLFAKDQENDFTVTWKNIPKASGDMQKADMLILWRDAFKEETPKKLQLQTLQILFDEEITKAKNK